MLLVTGATGTTGMEVLRALKAAAPRLARSCATRARPTSCASSASSPSTGDLGDPRTLGPALEGVERAYLVSPIEPDAVGVRAGVPGDRQGSGRQARRQALVIGASRGGAAALRAHARQGRARAQGVGHGLDAAAPDGVHAEHALLGPARAGRHVLRAGARMPRSDRRRPRRRRGRGRRAHRGGPRGQGVRPQRPRGGLLPRPGAARVRRRRPRGPSQGGAASRRSSASSCAPACRPGTPRASRSCSSSTPAAGRRWSPPASRTRSAARRAILTRSPQITSTRSRRTTHEHRRRRLGRGTRHVLRRQHHRGLLPGAAARRGAGRRAPAS